MRRWFDLMIENAGDLSIILTAEQGKPLAEIMAEDGEVTRVILATDGDFNVGLPDPEALKKFIADIAHGSEF